MLSLPPSTDVASYLKENADKLTINRTNVKEEMENYDDSKCDRVYQPVNTCDGNMENGTSAIITTMQSEENVEGVSDIGGRNSNMEESDEDLKMTVEEGEVFCQKRGNWLSGVVEKEGADCPDDKICNDDLHDQNYTLQAKGQYLQELREDSSFGLMTVNEDKEEEDGGISERKTRELSSKDKKSEKQPSNLSADNLLGRKSSDSMQTSMESSHGQSKKKKVRHQCEVCEYSTDRKSSLTAHMRVGLHTHEKPYVCEICNKGFKHKHHLQGHKRVHSGDKQFQCQVCGYSTHRKSNLTDHMSKHSKEKPYVCEICNKTFKLQKNLQGHKRLHSGDKQFQCEVCGYSTYQMSNLTAHMSKHSEEKPYVCEICNKSFKRKQYLQLHKSLHSGDKQFQCDNCGWRFSRKADMNKHMVTHTDSTSFKCKTCVAEFNQISRLHKHEKTQHENNPRVFPCNYCPYSSKHKYDTKEHEIRNHTKTYPYTCNVCKCGFITPGNLQKHMISKHKKQK